MYYREITKRPVGDHIVSDFITSDILGFGAKNKKLYKCYSNELVHDWVKSWGENMTPEDFYFHYIFDTSEFDWYINLKEHIVE